MDFCFKGNSQGVTISVRRFMIPEDVSLIYQWGTHHFGGRLWQNRPPISEISKVFQTIQESEIAQAFIVEANEEIPLFEIDVRLASADLAGTVYDVKEGDHLVCLLFAPNADKQQIDKGITTFIEYFFTKAPGIYNRLVVIVQKGDRFLHNVLVKSGFESLKSKPSGKNQMIYGLSKAVFMHRQLTSMN